MSAPSTRQACAASASGAGAAAAPRTLPELFRQVTTAHPAAVAFRFKCDGAWRDLTWAEQGAAVCRIAKSLLALGVEPGERVAILSETRLEWIQCDSAIVNVGAVTVGIYPSNLAAECARALEHAAVKVAFVEDDEQLQKVLPACGTGAPARHIVVIDGRGRPAAGILAWPAFLALGSDVADRRLDEIGRRVTPDDLAALVYTSGTTGAPKGAMLTHGNLVFVARAATDALRVQSHYCTLLFLPLAHVFARLIVYMCQQAPLTVAIAEDIGKVAINLREVRPHFIAGVPRIYEKVHERALTSAEEAGGLRRRLFRWALEVGRRAARLRQAGQPLPSGLALQQAIADRLVLRRVREAFGGRLLWAVSGAAPLGAEIGDFFQACGVTIIEGLGMTENSSLSNVNRPDRNKPGTVGPVVPGVEMKLAEDGEVLFRGPNVMLGYYRDPEATAETIDADGWLSSGDIGRIDADGFLTITDRKKDLIITAGGKNIAPQRIERALRTSRYISQIVACGDRRKFIVALLTLDAANILEWARRHGLDSKSVAELATEPQVIELIDSEIAERNRELASFESVKKFRILPRDLSIEAGDLTPTLKIRRKALCAKHRELIDSMYGE